MAVLIIVRHGETAWNLEARQQGQLDSPLTALGVSQAKNLGERLVRCSFSHLYSSDLGRAWHTAAIISAKTGHQVLPEPRLRERHLGVLQGLTKKEMQETLPEDYHVYKTGGPDQPIRQGQSLREFSRANVQAAEELASKHPGQTIVLVTHGGFLSSLFRHVLGIPLEAPRKFKLPNGSLNTFECENGKWFLHTWGDTSHLEGLQTRDDQ